jgi:hypothetical protein
MQSNLGLERPADTVGSTSATVYLQADAEWDMGWEKRVGGKKNEVTPRSMMLCFPVA